MKLDVGRLTRFRSQPGSQHEVRYNCPECDDEKGKLWANFKKGQWHCFHCGRGGTILNRDVVTGEAKFLKEGAPPEFEWKTYPDIRSGAVRYLEGRHIDPDVAWKCGWRSGREQALHRLIIPARYRDKNLSTRYRTAHATNKMVFPKTISSGKRKPMIVAWDSKEDNILYPGDSELAHRTLILVEGPADAMRLHCACQKEPFRSKFAVGCIFGKHLSEDNTFLLLNYFQNFYVMLDREARGELRPYGETFMSMQITEKLNAVADGFVGRHTWMKKGKWMTADDPAELNDDEAKIALRLALGSRG